MSDEIEPTVSASARRRIADQALRKLPYEATDDEKDCAITAIRASMVGLGPDATEQELVRAAVLAAENAANDCRNRLRREQWSKRAPTFLPFGADDDDRMEAVKIAFRELKSLPIDLPEWQVERKIKASLEDLSDDIRRENHIAQLIAHARGRVCEFLLMLEIGGAITLEELLDTELRQDLEDAVQERLQGELTGKETWHEADQIAREIVLYELEIEDDEPEEGY